MKKSIVFTICLLLSSVSMFAQESTTEMTIIREGVGLGSVVAVVLSWDRNKSILLAILHGIFSWLYVIYYALTRKSD